MIYSLSLSLVGVVVGLLLIASHLVPLLRPNATESWLKRFPRSRALGTVLVTAAGVWSFLLILNMDLGEFASLRRVILVAIAAGTYLAWRYMEEFLAVRALGMLALLAADPVLSAAFLQPPASRLLVVVLAYAWIFLGLFWVGMPWILRDQILWLVSRRPRLQTAAWAGLVYGAVILVCDALFWR